MQKTLSLYKHVEQTISQQKLFPRQELSRVYVDDDGHLIAVFNDDSELDITELFDFIKQS